MFSGSEGQVRKTDHSVPPYRSVRALLTHTTPTSSIWRENASLDKDVLLVLWLAAV